MVTSKAKKPAAAPTAESQLAAFVAKFEPKHQTLIRETRKALRKRFPTATELVYDNYNFFVIGYSPTARPSDAIISIAAGANGVSICFIHGARLDDPTKVMQGGGKQTRFVRLTSAGDVVRPDIAALLTSAEARAKVPMRASGKGELVIQSVSAKQRPRRRES